MNDTRSISVEELMATFELSRQQASLLNYLLKREYADAWGLAALVGNPAVPMHRLKLRLAKYGLEITTCRGTGGYRLDPDMRILLLQHFDEAQSAIRESMQELAS